MTIDYTAIFGILSDSIVAVFPIALGFALATKLVRMILRVVTGGDMIV